MSIKLVNRAFETNLAPTPKIVLISLCDFANDEGICFPSLATLANKASVQKTNLTYILKTFEILKVITRETRKRENGSNTSTVYYIKNIENSNQKEYKKTYQNVKKYKPKSQSEQDSKKTKVNNAFEKSEQLEPSSFNCKINLSSKKRREDFNSFKRKVIKEYQGKYLVKNVDGYLPETIISISDTGYLHNCYCDKDLEPESAIKVWQWLYRNSHMIGNVE